MKVSHKKLNTGVSSEQLSILSRLKLYFFEISEISYFEHNMARAEPWDFLLMCVLAVVRRFGRYVK